MDNKRKELIYKMAEEMAKNDVPLLFSEDNMKKSALNNDRSALIASFMKCAENVVVKFGENMFEEGYRAACWTLDCDPDNMKNDLKINKELKGFI